MVTSGNFKFTHAFGDSGTQLVISLEHVRARRKKEKKTGTLT
jgi:hypothetical protein